MKLSFDTLDRRLIILKGETTIPQTPSVLHSSILAQTHAELEGDANQIRKPVELTVRAESIAESPNEIDNLMADIKGKLKRDYT